MEPRQVKERLEDYPRVMRGRYTRRTGKSARSVSLDKYCQSTGLDREYANKMQRLWRASLQRHRGCLEGGREERLKGISAAEIDREMALYRSAGRQRRAGRHAA